MNVRPALRTASSPVVVVPVALAVGLAMLLVAGALLTPSAARVGRAQVGDTGPVLAGAEPPTDGTAGPPGVVLTPSAAAFPRSAAVRDVLQRWVDARNAHDAAAWAQVVVPGAGGPDSATFGVRNRTERLGSVTVRRIDPVGGGDLVVPLNYVTTQDPAEAPPDVRSARLCWQVALSVGQERGGDRITEPRPGSALRTPC